MRGAVVGVCLAALAPLAPGPRDGSVRHEGSRLSMACVYSVVAYGAGAGELRAAVESALDEVDRIDRLMSHYRPESPLSRLNRDAGGASVPVDPELFAFLAECLRYSRDSGGAFDVTVGPLMRAWGFFRGEGRLPSEGELSDARRRVGYRHVEMDFTRGTVRFGVPGVELDLGGIAKGYAVDRAVGVLRSRGVRAALVNAGGSTLFALGAPPGRRAWEVTVEDPLTRGEAALRLRLTGRALSVAGTREKWFEAEGRRYSHVMDPRTGRPVEGILSVAVVAESGTAADALDDAFFVEGVGGTREHLARLPSVEVVFFVPEAGDRWKAVRPKS